MGFFNLKFKRVDNEPRLTCVDHWEELQGEINLFLSEDEPVNAWIKKNFNFSGINNCFEVGCYPGKFLMIFADKKIEINGIDYIPQTKKLKEVLLNNSINVGEIFCADFLETKIDRKFDCVYSLGFIEHFENWEVVLDKHINLVNTGGYLMIECPNYRGMYQRIPKFLFDRRNLLRHNLSSMKLDKWCEILLRNHFEIIYSDYFGGYLLWFIKQSNNSFFLIFRGLIVKILVALVKLKKKENDKSFSSYMGIIAKKK
jgi:L-malate glycosyltransferase